MPVRPSVGRWDGNLAFQQLVDQGRALAICSRRWRAARRPARCKVMLRVIRLASAGLPSGGGVADPHRHGLAATACDPRTYTEVMAVQAPRLRA